MEILINKYLVLIRTKAELLSMAGLVNIWLAMAMISQSYQLTLYLNPFQLKCQNLYSKQMKPKNFLKILNKHLKAIFAICNKFNFNFIIYLKI